MRVLLSTIGSRGDVQPLVALGAELRRQGHAVRLCTPPDFQDWIEGLGLEMTPIGPPVSGAVPRRPVATSAPISGDDRRRMAEATVGTQFETIAAAASDCDVIVAATALQIAARSVAEMRGIPYVFAAYCPVVLPSLLHAPPRLPPIPGDPPLPPTTDHAELWARDGARFGDLFGGALNAHRASLGLAPVHGVRGHVFTDQPWLAADPTLAPWPDTGDRVLQTGAWILPDTRRLSPALESFLASGAPPVYVGFGSTRVGEDLGLQVRQAARALGRRVLVSRGWAGLASGEDESDCLTIGDENLELLFPRVAAVVHHGGAGTTTAAARAGAPQVVVPHVYDQFYFAARVSALGIGVAHDEGTVTPESVGTALGRALQPDMGVSARALAPEVRRDGATVAARELLALVGRWHGRPS